jgi:hypothetical protein
LKEHEGKEQNDKIEDKIYEGRWAEPTTTEVYMLMVSTSGNKVVNIEMKEVNEAAQRVSLAQQLDPFCQSIMSYILLGQLPKDRTTARSIKY